MHLSLSFLGSFQVTLENQPAKFATDRARALLAYLAVEADRPHRREALAYLLWPDHPESRARQNLSQALARARRAIHDRRASPPFLRITAKTLQFDAATAELDLARFQALLAVCAGHPHQRLESCPDCVQRLEKAAELYRGEFLVGLSLADSQPFEEWMLFRREQCHRQALDVLHTLAVASADQGAYEQAQRYAERQLSLEPWREEAHQQLIWALAQGGQRSAALSQYHNCCRILADELGAEVSAETTALYEQIRAETWSAGSRALVSSPPAYPKEDWGDAPVVGAFYGREAEATELARWLLDEPCRLVTVLGMGGIGKTALVANVARSLAGQFDYVFWRSLLNAPPPTDVLRACLQFLGDQDRTDLRMTLDEQLALLFEHLRRARCLLVLDNVESVMQQGACAGQFRPGYEGYDQLVRRMGEGEHRSCLLLTSRERPRRLESLAHSTSHVRSLPLTGLTVEAGRRIVQAHGLSAPAEEIAALVRHYSGNPLALALVARTIRDLYDGDVATYLDQGMPVFGDIREVLDRQFERLSPLEQEILVWLAIEREGVSIGSLAANFLYPPSKRTLLEALRSLQRRSLLAKTAAGFTLQNVVIEYVTDRLVEQICGEIADERLDRFHSHALLKAQANEHVRQSQARLILQPIAQRLIANAGKMAAVEKFQSLLAHLRVKMPYVPSYAGGNLLNLLLHMDVDVRGYDFSCLSVRQAYLRGAGLAQVNFARCDLAHSVFGDTFVEVYAVAFSPDGQMLAAGTASGEVRLWQLPSLQPCGVLGGHSHAARAVAFSPDGRTLASGSWDQTIRLWDTDSGELRHVLQGHSDWITAVAFSPDGRTLASGARDHTVRLWDTGNGQLIRTLCRHTGPVRSVAFSPDGHYLASGSIDQTLCLWDVARVLALGRTETPVEGQTYHRLQGHTSWVNTIAFSPNDRVLASGGYEGTIRLWDLDTLRTAHVLRGHASWVESIAFHPDGHYLASGSMDQTVRLWDLDTRQTRHVLQGHTAGCGTVAFSPDGARLASGSADRTIRLWDLRSGQALHTLQGYKNIPGAVAFHPHSRILASGGDDQLVRLWDVDRAKIAQTFHGHTHTVRPLAFHPDGKVLASGSYDGTIRLWDVCGGRTRHILRGHANGVFGVAFAPNGAILATAGGDGAIRLWDVEDGQTLAVLRGHTDDVVYAVAFCPDGRILASSSRDRTVRLWDVRSGQLLQTLYGHAHWVRTVTFGPDGQTLVSGSDDKTVRLWDVRSGAALHILKDHTDLIWSVVFSPDGKTLATASEDRTIRLRDADTLQTIRILSGHTAAVNSAAFSADGRILASSSQDETIRLWDVPAGMCLRTLQIDRPYTGMDITGATGLTEVQRAALRILGAVEGE